MSTNLGSCWHCRERQWLEISKSFESISTCIKKEQRKWYNAVQACYQFVYDMSVMKLLDLITDMKYLINTLFDTIYCALFCSVGLFVCFLVFFFYLYFYFKKINLSIFGNDSFWSVLSISMYCSYIHTCIKDIECRVPATFICQQSRIVTHKTAIWCR